MCMHGVCQKKGEVGGLVKLSMFFKDIAALSIRCCTFFNVSLAINFTLCQVRYNHGRAVIATSGVEKVVKLWSTLPLPQARNGSRESGRDRQVKKYMPLKSIP